jgi:hypothetical protein
MQQYILKKHIKNKSSTYICMPSKLKHFAHNFLTIINSHKKNKVANKDLENYKCLRLCRNDV